MLIVDTNKGFGGGQKVLSALVQLLSHSTNIHLIATNETLRDEVCERDYPSVSLRKTMSLIEYSKRVRCGDFDFVIANGAKSLISVSLLKVACAGSSNAVFAYVDHSFPLRRRDTIVLSLLSRLMDEVWPVALSQRASRPNSIELSPLGLTRQDAARDMTTTVRSRHAEKGPIRCIKAMARTDPVKGIDILIAAWKDLSPKYPEWRLSLALRDSITEQPGAYAETLRKNARPFLVEGERSSSWFKADDVVVIPSRSEAAPLTLQEAMLAECLVIVSDVGDMGITVRHGQNGMVFSAENTAELTQVLDKVCSMDITQRRSMAKAARATAVSMAGKWYADISNRVQHP